MKQLDEVKRYLNARKHIRQFAGEYAEKSGEDPKDVERDILQAKKRNHISFAEYEWTGYYHLTPEQKKTISTLWTRMEFRKQFTDRRYIGMLMNKYIFSKVFGDFYGRWCMRASEADAKSLREMAKESGRVVYKPNCKGMGQGIRVLSARTEEEAKEALQYIQKSGGGIVEEYICQDDLLTSLNPNAVSVIRFYSASSPEGEFLFAPVLTVAHKNKSSNGCKDALTAMVDIRTGEVLTDAVDQNSGEIYQAHPSTGMAFKGLKLNNWDKTIQMMRRALPLGRKISNIGWDVALTKEGPILVEANTIPGFMTAQYAGFGWITDGYGYQPLFDAVHGKSFEDDGRYERVVLKLE